MNELLIIAYELYKKDIVNSKDIFSSLLSFDNFINNEKINKNYIQKSILILRNNKIKKIINNNDNR